MFIQAGADEILLADSIGLEERARACGVPCRLEIHERRRHVFQLQAWQLRGPAAAIEALGEYARRRIGAAPYLAQGGARFDDAGVLAVEEAAG